MSNPDTPETLSSPKRRPRILLSAYTVDPMGGSESMVGWQRCVQAARYFDTWVVCAPDVSREGIDEYVAEHGPIDNLEIVYVAKSKLLETLERIPGLFYMSYNLWQRRARRAAERLDKRVHFDLIHQVNMCGYREPGYLWKLDAPFVWGPIGGTQNYPTRFLRHAGIVGGSREAVRTVLNLLTMRWSRRVRHAAARASALRAANTTVARDLAKILDRERVDVMLEVGAPAVTQSLEPRHRRDGEALRLLWAGEFRAFKALPQLLDALSALPHEVDWHLTVAGDGPERARWRRHTQDLGLDDRVVWLGWIPHAEMQDQFLDADLFVFTSLRDTTGSVVLEALASGTPVLAPAHQGVGDVVNRDCGVLVPVTTYPAMVSAYRDAIDRLCNDPDLLMGLSEGARRRADYYSWQRQGERMRDVYNDVLTRATRESTT